MEVKSCFFIGHREADSFILPSLTETIDRHIAEYGVTEFFVGGYGDFDRLAGQAVIAAKAQHPEIRLYRLLPYHPAERPVKTPKGYDSTYYPEGMEQVPRRAAIIRANRYMVDTCDYLIAFVYHPASNARELLEYARRKERGGNIHVENLAENDTIREALFEHLRRSRAHFEQLAGDQANTRNKSSFG